MTEQKNDEAKSDEGKTGVADLVTPEEHAEVAEGIELGESVADESVPADVEIAARSADMDTPSDTYEKVFVLGPNPYSPNRNPYTETSGFDHEPNKAATRQYAIDAGLWPTGDVRFKSAKKHVDGASWALTYAVDVIPAHNALDGAPAPEVVASNGDAEGARNYVAPSSADGKTTD